MPGINFDKKTLVIALIIIVIIIAVGYWYCNRNKTEPGEDKQERKNVKAICTDPEPDAPRDVKITPVEDSDSATITWLSSADIDVYYVYHYYEDPLKAANPINIIPSKTHFLKVDKLRNGKHWFRVRAKRGCAPSDFSESVQLDIDIDCYIELTDDLLNPEYNSGVLSWNRIEGSYSYGILIMYENYNKQILISDVGHGNAERIELTGKIDETIKLNDIIMCVVNGCGQSNLIYIPIE